MSESRYVTDMVKIGGRPALVNVTIHPSGTRYVHLDTIDYIDGENQAAQAPTPEQHRRECAAQLAAPEPYRSPMRPILAIVAIVWSISCAILGAATFGTDPLTLLPFLGGAAWWCASVALGAYAYKAIRAALR